MAYIGRDPQYGAFEKQALTADSSTTTFTLDYTVGSASSLLVSVAGVHQEPETAYNLGSNGTTIVFTAAPASGDTVFVVFLGIARDVGQFLNSGIKFRIVTASDPFFSDSGMKRMLYQNINFLKKEFLIQI